MVDHTGFHRLPMATSGQAVGLLGGSFDPPHAGHLHISRRAIRRFRLDQVWWLVSPGNPLKDRDPAGFARRLAACRELVSHPRIRISDAEAQLGTRHTSQTLAALQPRYPGVRFVWLMGADNLASFHHWENWQAIMDNVPIGVLARPGKVVAAGSSPAASAYAKYRLPTTEAAGLAHRAAPCWCLLPGPSVDISSTGLRNRGEWVR